jgi:flavin-dependent dehydrogenase
MRQHFHLKPWSDFVEVHWATAGQAYVTPIAADEICVAMTSKRRFPSFDLGLAQFPELLKRVGTATRSSRPRGAVTINRRLRRVTNGKVVLIGEASGSVDAITGEGLAMAFRQALALASSLAREDLSIYEESHRKIAKLPTCMANAMLLMDKSPWLRSRAIRAFAKKPHLFEQMLSMHVGKRLMVPFGADRFLNLAWNLLTI